MGVQKFAQKKNYPCSTGRPHRKKPSRVTQHTRAATEGEVRAVVYIMLALVGLVILTVWWSA